MKSTATVPLNDSKVSGPVHSIAYDIALVIHLTREERRARYLADMARIFESAFDASEVRPS